MGLREPCAICDTTNAHSRLCRVCARDPVNADWVSGDEETGAMCDVGDEAVVPLAVALDLPLRALTPLGQRICAVFLAKEPRTYHDPRRHALVVRRVNVRKRYRAVARVVGCSEAYVRRVIERIDRM